MGAAEQPSLQLVFRRARRGLHYSLTDKTTTKKLLEGWAATVSKEHVRACVDAYVTATYAATVFRPRIVEEEE
jgi:hypothetical protein